MASSSRSRATPSRPVGKTQRTRGVMTSKQPVQGILSVKELTSELEKTKRNEVLLKTRIRSLETEVETLRARLDSLRKAKNTTIIKRERDQPLVPLSPKLGHKGGTASRPPSTSAPLSPSPSSLSLSQDIIVERLEDRIRGLENRLSSKDEEHEEKLHLKELELRNVFEKELESKRKKDDNENSASLVRELRDEISKLISRNDELTAQLFSSQESNKRTVKENEALEEKCSRLEEDLSTAEEKWKRKVDQLQAEVRTQWGERYHEWITKAEKKMEELQKVNAILQTMLKSKVHNPEV